ncbi:hypothetical protein Tco_0770609 [Tanacetum coccineum]|uniref:Reverse transcriptase domain-containing protein n=1 Tax=Tanacetum coccineum TaxID=301880 RepID=A0ABQ4ZCQ3_9ASTR
MAPPGVVLDMIKSFPRGTSCGRDGLRAQHLIDYLSGAAVAISDEVIASITQVVNLFLDGKCLKMLGEYIASALLTPLVKPGGGIHPIAVDIVWRRLVSKIKDSFSLSLHAWYLDDGIIIGDTLVVGKPNEDPRSRLMGVFPPIIARPLHGVKLLGGPVSVDFNFSGGLVLKRVAKSIELMDVVAKLNDPQCELLLLRACAGISKLYFAMRTCSPQVFERAQHSFDAALCSSLERIVTASGPGFGNWQWRLAILSFSYEGLGVYSAGDVLSYVFLASRLQSASLQTKLLRHFDIVSSGLAFDNALNAFNVKMEIGLLSNPNEIAASKLMKKLADIYFTSVTQMAESTFYLSTQQMALWKSQMEDHTSYWLKVVQISGLGQTMNGRTYRVFMGDIYGDHAVSCAGIVGIKHRHNVLRDTLVDICYRSEISSGKEVDIGLGSSPLTQTGMVDFMLGRAMLEAAQRKRVKYEAKCADIRYGFLPFLFSSFGELEKDTVTLLKRIRKFSVAQDNLEHACYHHCF